MVAAVTAERPERVAGEAFRVEAGHDVLGAQDVAVDEGDVILAIATVPEAHDLEAAEARRQVGHRFDLHAHAVRAEALAVVIFVALDEIPEAWNG